MSYFCPMASRSASVSIRGVRTGDVGRLQAIQLAAGDAFRYVGMSTVAESPPLTAESLSGYREAGRAPYYERLGFRELAASEVTPGLAARRAAGPGADGDSYARVCMRRDLIADGPPVT